MKTYIIWCTLCAVGLFLSACTFTITPPTPAPSNPNSVIFTAELSKEYLHWLNTGAVETWTPTDEDVATLESALFPFLQTAESPWLQPDPPIWERAPDYMRQYLGLVEGGEQVIFANFFCRPHADDWHTQLVAVEDGGDCFFSVKYNVATGEFYDLYVNGEA